MVTTNIKCVIVNSWIVTPNIWDIFTLVTWINLLMTQNKKTAHTAESKYTLEVKRVSDSQSLHDNRGGWPLKVPNFSESSSDVLNSSRCTNTNSIYKIWVQLFVGVTWSQLPGVLAVFPAGQWSISTSEQLHCSLSAVPADSNSKLPAIDVLWMSEVPPSTWRFFYFGKQLLTFGSQATNTSCLQSGETLLFFNVHVLFEHWQNVWMQTNPRLNFIITHQTFPQRVVGVS